jgi:uncharacterized protein
MSKDMPEESLTTAETPSAKKKKGFAALTPERRRELARMGGQKAQASGNAHRWGSEDAQIAGAKGGAVHARKVAEAKKNGQTA